VTGELEAEVWDWFKAETTTKQQQRLKQLEYYSQSGRMVFRADVTKQLEIDASQLQRLASSARVTDKCELALAKATSGPPELSQLKKKFQQAAKAEGEALMSVLRPEQRSKLKSLLGPPFDTGSLKRVYAMAPEFVPVDDWINSSALTMQGLRGKVVLVHFYAFQCHNCHANFPIYQRWHRELTDKGVVMVGIQTPETTDEANVAAVEAAAVRRDLKFPILIDLKSDNWKAWGNTMWPCVYVIDKKGYVRYWWQGELNWDGATGDKTIEAEVSRLLAED
jgi:peroxiredoxin